MLAVISSLSMLTLFILKRYVPVWKVPFKNDWLAENCNSTVILDVRDYNESCNNHIQGAIELPVAYLKRYYKEIPKENILLVASDNREKNVSIRFLRKKGFNIVGCTNLKVEAQELLVKSI
ncbi:rhodanese-like domain-containing protein [Pseudalkalibacillus sp. SCS-8]|uniref:rhodanese-like domain-containing protein n=1 Tax=Pseudalkalibacillus nanhaiensis TaxID=3115291 RepID=UPI0032DABF6B